MFESLENKVKYENEPTPPLADGVAVTVPVTVTPAAVVVNFSESLWYNLTAASSTAVRYVFVPSAFLR